MEHDTKNLEKLKPQVRVLRRQSAGSYIIALIFSILAILGVIIIPSAAEMNRYQTGLTWAIILIIYLLLLFFALRTTKVVEVKQVYIEKKAPEKKTTTTRSRTRSLTRTHSQAPSRRKR